VGGKKTKIRGRWWRKSLLCYYRIVHVINKDRYLSFSMLKCHSTFEKEKPLAFFFEQNDKEVDNGHGALLSSPSHRHRCIFSVLLVGLLCFSFVFAVMLSCGEHKQISLP
jgi:hypothetical protein